jgi:hypothetical protein
MAVRTTVQAGNWSNPAIWDTGVPVAGDTAVINHYVVVDQDAAVGTSPASGSAAVLTVTGSGWKTVSGCADNGSGLIRVTTTAAHGLVTGDKVYIWLIEGTVEANSITTLTISGCADNGSGLIRVTFSGQHGLSTDDEVAIAEVTGTLEANRIWKVTVVDSTKVDLQNSQFQNAYISGGVGHSPRNVHPAWTVTVISSTVFDLQGSTFRNAYSGTPTAGSVGKVMLEIAAGKTLTVKGDTLLSNAPLLMQTGAALTMDTSGAADPANTSYNLQVGNESGTVSRLLMNGTSSNRARIEHNNGPGTAYLSGLTQNKDQCVCLYGHFLRLGSSSVQAIRICPDGRYYYLWMKCLFESCGRLYSSVFPDAQARVLFLWNTFTGSTANENLAISYYNTRSTGHYLIQGNVFDSRVGASCDNKSLTLTDNVFQACLMFMRTSAWELCHHNVIGNTGAIPGGGTTAFNLSGPVKNNYLIWIDNPNNPHMGDVSTKITMTIEDCLVECTGTDRTGDIFIGGASTQAHTVTIKGCVLLPNGIGEHPGSFVSLLGASFLSMVIEHNTFLTALNTLESGGVTVGETYAGYAGMVQSFKSNLAWSPTGQGYKFNRRGGEVQDICAPANADYNGGYNLTAGTDLKGYTHTVGTSATFTSAPGTHDVDAPPQFRDPTRNFAKWGQVRWGTNGTAAAAMAQLAADVYLIDDLLTWVRQGWAPTNAAYQGTAHDGGDIGAVPVAAATAPTYSRLRLGNSFQGFQAMGGRVYEAFLSSTLLTEPLAVDLQAYFLKRYGPAFLPSSIADLFAWHDAGQGVTIDVGVSQWSDLSGNGHHLVQATGIKQPLLVNGVINGKPVVRFDGVDDFLETTLGATVSAHTFFMVFKGTVSGTDLGLMRLSNTSGTQQGLTWHANSAIYSYHGDGSRYVRVSGRSPGVPYIVTRLWNGGLTAADMNLWVNNTAGTKYSTPVATFLSAKYNLGQCSTISGGYFGGDIAEVLLYNRALEQSEIDTIERWLAAKYLISGSW